MKIKSLFLKKMLIFCIPLFSFIGLSAQNIIEKGIVASGVQFDVVSNNNSIALISDGFFEFDAMGNIVNTEKTIADRVLSSQNGAPSVDFGADGSIHIITRGPVSQKISPLHYSKRNSAGNWQLINQPFGNSAEYNYKVEIAGINNDNAILMHTLSEDEINASTSCFFYNGANFSHLGNTAAISRTDAGIAAGGNNDTVFYMAGFPWPGGHVNFGKAAFSSASFVNELESNFTKLSEGNDRRDFPFLCFDAQNTAYYTYGARQNAVYFNKMSNGQPQYANDKQIFTDLGSWPKSMGLSSVAAMGNGDTLMAVALVAGGFGDQESNEMATNSEIAYKFSYDGGDTWTERQLTGKITSAEGGNLIPRVVALGDEFFLFYKDNDHEENKISLLIFAFNDNFDSSLAVSTEESVFHSGTQFIFEPSVSMSVKEKKLNLQNNLLVDMPVTISPSGDFSVSEAAFSLLPTEKKSIDVSILNNVAVGQKSGQLVISYGGAEDFIIDLKGEVTEAGNVLPGYDDLFEDDSISVYYKIENELFFDLDEADGVMHFDVHKTDIAYGFSCVVWEPSNAEDTFFIDMSENPYISVKVKSDADFVLQLGPKNYDQLGNPNALPQGGAADPHNVIGDGSWQTLYFDYTEEFAAEGTKGDSILKIYMNFDPGYQVLFSGNVWIDDFKIGASAERPTTNLKNLRVESGTGTGDYLPETVVQIIADPAPGGKKFEQWTGANEYIDDVTNDTAYFTMPDMNITVKAIFGYLTRYDQTSLPIMVSYNTMPFEITLDWEDMGATGYNVYRKLPEDYDWGAAIASLSGSEFEYTDATANQGEIYEYRVEAVKSPSADGYILCGQDIAANDFNGSVLLLVDSNFTEELKPEIDLLVQDLTGDGWQVVRDDINRTASVPYVKNIIKNYYVTDTFMQKSVFLLGHIPVPKSGYISPDGHEARPFPADMYYGDVVDDAGWTDLNTNGTVNGIPDGYFDQNSLPGYPTNKIELAVGRVDFEGLTHFQTTESALMKTYLDKLHKYKHGKIKVPFRGLVEDNFGPTYSEYFGSTGYRNFYNLLGKNNVVESDYDTLRIKPYLFAFGCGPGGHTSTGGVVKSSDYANEKYYAVFNNLFGSYHGEWDHSGNVMRSSLANDGYALTCSWSGRPYLHFHQMGMGYPIGETMKISQGNTSTGPYVYNNNVGRIHPALMGDPTLTMHVVSPPESLEAAKDADTCILYWQSSNSDVDGYYVYRYSETDGMYFKISELITTNNYKDTLPMPGENKYMVRPLDEVVAFSGSYNKIGQGAFIEMDMSTAPEIELATNIIIDAESGKSNVQVNKNLQLFALVEPLTASVRNVKWTLQNETGTAVLSTDGILTGTSEGTVKVIAEAMDGSGITAEKVFNVGDPLIIMVEDINVASASGTTISSDDGTLQLEAEVLPADAYNKGIEWSVSNTALAGVSVGGLVSAFDNGSLWVIATAKDGSGVSDSIEIVISNQVLQATSVGITADAGATGINVDKGTLQLFFEVLPPSVPDQTVTWEISNDSLATVDATGLVSALDNGKVWVSYHQRWQQFI